MTTNFENTYQAFMHCDVDKLAAEFAAMLMHMAVAAYTAASIDKVDAPLEKVWEAIDAENESAYDDETIQIAKEKMKVFRAALFNATYYTMLCEQTKKTVLEGLQDSFGGL